VSHTGAPGEAAAMRDGASHPGLGWSEEIVV
jgi:hypothetical protein